MRGLRPFNEHVQDLRKTVESSLDGFAPFSQTLLRQHGSPIDAVEANNQSTRLPVTNHSITEATLHIGEDPRISSAESTERFSGGGDSEELSDADSDYREFRTVISNFKETVLDLRESRIGRPTRRGAPRGPRKAVEPSGEIKLRLGEANRAFLEQRYADAASLASEIVRLNAETYEAWTLMAGAFKEVGDNDNALKALLFAAHLRPKISETWMLAAKYALEETGSLRAKYLINAQFAYAGAIRADPRNIQARLGKANVCIERGQIGPAISEYKFVVARRPQDLENLQKLAELSIDNGEIQPVIEMYKRSIVYYKSSSAETDIGFSWTDLDSYITLYEFVDQYSMGIHELKSVGRWLLGREKETFWDRITENDCEWDREDSRRKHIEQFETGQHPLVSYGEGLPSELRLKLALYRLKSGCYEEAMIHVAILDLVTEGGYCKDLDSISLLRPIADCLQEMGYYDKALHYYRSLANTSGVDSSTLVQMGKCLLHLGLDGEARKSFEDAIRIDATDVNARMELARMLERLEKPMEAFQYINEAMLLRKHQTIGNSRGATRRTIEEEKMTNRSSSGSHHPKSHQSLAERPAAQADETSKSEHLKFQFQVLRKEHDRMRLGNPIATSAWIDAAKDLTDDFRSFKTFYPWDKYIKFLGYSGDSRTQAETVLDSDLSAMAERLSQGIREEFPDIDRANVEIPDDYRGVSFSMWLDIFLEYAMCLARCGKSRESYELCEAAKDAVVFYHSREDMFLIHICWCLCSLLSSDEETCVHIARFFMKDYQFATDSYRMFSAIARVCHSPVSWYSSGPTQKYILRQIKAMDYALVDDARKEKFFAERGSYTARDDSGNLVVNSDMDIALLMLYGHILFAGTSYGYALNYFFRAHALDSTNPMIHMSLGLAYIHQALKRQSDNRQHNILQGITFMLSYYEIRRQAMNLAERQEAHYNVARAYHLLGLPHLAVPYYIKVLEETSDNFKDTIREDIIIDAVYNLQLIYANAGNLELARKLTRDWLQI